ncbi:MAG: hypothetical protein LLG14_01120 [Nocardiaceae bacterium]|nr:hypothetical protein [Nocardiaceae bacterium]
MPAEEFLHPTSHDDAIASAIGDGYLDAGPLDMDHATIDVDGDGILDTVVGSLHIGHEAAMFVATDTDQDGTADTLKIVGGNGEFSSFEYEADATGHRWHEVDRGKLAE